ncbi:MAG: DUF4932 domain-containing protein [Acidobacteria bacterium]|nr:DUF4932 domain-containing protein [Acidobacteriota bacterium]
MKKVIMRANLFRRILWGIAIATTSLQIAIRPAVVKASPQREAITVIAKIDQRVELMSIVARLAGYKEYVRNDFKLYANDVDRHFDKYRQHGAVQFAVKIRESNSVSFDAVMTMAVHLNPPPSLTPRVIFSDQIPERRWGKEAAEQFAVLLQQFYKDADCENFFKSHSDLYRTAEHRFQQLLGKVNFEWYRKFYGEMPKGTFNLYIGLLNGGGNYGPKVINADGTEDLYAIIGTNQTDSEGLPLYNERSLPTIIHEFNHSFINHLINERKEQFRVAGEKVYQPIAGKMKSLAYGNWETTIIESLVRAAVIRYLLEDEAQSEAAYKELLREQRNGFLWMDELVALLGTYENSRSFYLSLRSFLPLIEGYYKDLAKRMDFKIKKYDESRPRVIAIAPIANGAQDVDPSITQLTFTFDKPLDPKAGYSINAGQSGMEHYPVEKVVGYNESGSTVTLQVKLKPDWNYEFTLTDLVFRTKDGIPLLPYTVTFKTKNQ